MENTSRNLAFITGASSGIGAAFASHLAQDGFDLVLHGRRHEKLKELASNLEETHNISTDIMIAELSRSEEIERVEDRIQGLDRLDMLINNAGYWIPGSFWERTPESLEAMIRVHVIGSVRFTRAALPGMLERNRGDIINVSSFGAYFNTMTVENYCATKAYLVSFSESLHVALMKTNIRVQVLVPGLTLTEFHSRLGADVTAVQHKWMQPEELVGISLRALDRGQVVCIPTLKDKFLIRFSALLPRGVYYRVMYRYGEKIWKGWERIRQQ